MTYGELRDLVASYAAKVAEAGIRPGDRVVLIAPTGAEFVAAYYGLHAAGAVLITMNVMATAPEIDYVLADADASLVVAWHEAAGAATKAASDRGLPLWTLAPLAGVAHGRSAARLPWTGPTTTPRSSSTPPGRPGGPRAPSSGWAGSSRSSTRPGSASTSTRRPTGRGRRSRSSTSTGS